MHFHKIRSLSVCTAAPFALGFTPLHSWRFSAMQNSLKQIQYTFLLGDLSLVPTVPTVKAEDTCNFFNPILQTPSVLQKILAFPSSLTGKTQGRWGGGGFPMLWQSRTTCGGGDDDDVLAIIGTRVARTSSRVPHSSWLPVLSSIAQGSCLKPSQITLHTYKWFHGFLSVQISVITCLYGQKVTPFLFPSSSPSFAFPITFVISRHK